MLPPMRWLLDEKLPEVLSPDALEKVRTAFAAYHTNPYGRFDLDMTTRLALDAPAA